MERCQTKASEDTCKIPECLACENYANGEGTAACRRCPTIEKYLRPDAGRREPRPMDVDVERLPAKIVEHGLLDVLHQMPLAEGTVLMQRYYLNASYSELAVYHQCSVSTVKRMIRRGVRMVRGAVVGTAPLGR